ncbi:MAG: putative DNA excision repair protein ERCC-1 [Streblomastix strix]|uniref:Putative DNA excision repair protein ERCC-1 n=1 Tax=Streblomastix strix TaxID=222440 RepID=A0A5J4W2A7_9EUKA|nr:MAG: putative DNA excision repair protein ERCC-1 [Streblomastix strix]
MQEQKLQVVPYVFQPQNTIFASTRQRGNPCLPFVRLCKVEYHPLIPDFVFGRKAQGRIGELFNSQQPGVVFPYINRFLLCLVDTSDVNSNTALSELNLLGVKENISIILAWSKEQMAQHLESICSLQSRSIDPILGKGSGTHLAKATECLTTIPSISKNDAYTLLEGFGKLSDIFEAPRDLYELLPGFGQTKAKRLFECTHEPFLNSIQSSSSSPITPQNILEQQPSNTQ